MKQILNVNINNNNSNNGYNINISDDSFAKLIEDINKATQGQNKLYVISQKVYKLYKNELCLNEDEIFILKDGESSKNINNYIKILNAAIRKKLTRSDAIIAIGGGVVGDITGFVASTYMRGINYIQVPTTLLSMVDSSVGGKTAIDMDGVKNIVGSFYQPKEVFININFLKTLDKKQYMSGLGEILKYAFIEDNCGFKHSLFLFEYLTLSCEKLLEKESMTLFRVIEYCLNLKISVVNEDEKENGLRKILNLGHTLGHAIESITNYRKYTHGEAVIQGIFFILNWAYSQEKITYSYYRLSTELLTKYGFKNLNLNKKYSPEKLLEIIKHDKKASKDNITFVIPVEKKKVKVESLSTEVVFEMLNK